jgi:hypothetical protein
MKFPEHHVSGSTRKRLWLATALACGMAAYSAPALGQATTQPAAQSVSPQLLQQMMQRMDAQDAEIKELQAKLAAQAAAAAVAPVAAPAATATADTQESSEVQTQVATQAKEIAVLQRAVKQINSADDAGPTYPTLQFHGFGDVDYHASTNNKVEKNSFYLGEFDFFLSSQLSPDLNVLSETVISADDTNTDAIEIERLLLQWDPSDFFNVDIGRYHTDIGYYNTAFHHGTWFQTATNRPFFDQFEDSGGIIPAHTVGFSIHGNIPGKFASKLGLGYFVEVGNGHQYESPGSSNNSVTNVIDENDFKAFNLALISRPEAIPGLEVGAGVYHDTITPNSIDAMPSGPAGGIPRTDELFVHSHLVYKNADWEFMSEAYAVNHNTKEGSNVWSPAYYAQLGRKIGDFTPYARFTYFDGNKADEIYQLSQVVGQHYGPSIGVRYDVSTFVALKLQYDYFVNSQEGTALTLPFQQIPSGSYSELEFQVAFTY